MSSSEKVAEFLSERVEQHMARIGGVTSPVYFQTRSGASHVGSAVLLSVAGIKFVVTAAHVVDASLQGELFIRAGTTPVRIRGTKTTPKLATGASRDRDKIDIAIIALDEASAERFPATDFLTVQELAPLGTLRHEDYFLVAGYPGSKQRLRLREDQIDAALYPLVAVSQPASEYPLASMSPAENLLLGFNKKDTWRRDVGRLTAPDPYGMSGCGVWWLQGYTSSVLSPPRLDAIAIEWHTGRYKRMLATRMHVVIDGLKQVFPATRDELP